MTVEMNLSTMTVENSEVEVEIEETNELNLTSVGDQEKDGEVCDEIVSDTEEKSDGEVKDARESSYVFITKESESPPEQDVAVDHLTGDIEGNDDAGEENFNLEEGHIDEDEKTSDTNDDGGSGLESEGEVIGNPESEVLVLDDCELENADNNAFVKEDIELEINACPVNNAQFEIENTDCSSEMTEGETKKDGDSTYVFVDMVSNEPTERTYIIEESKLCEFPQSVIVGSVICGMHQIPTSGSHESSHGSRDIATSEAEMENSTSDRCDHITSHRDSMNGAASMNDLRERDTIESASPVKDAYFESEVGSSHSLRNTDSTFSSSSHNSDEKVAGKMEKKPIFRYLIRVPRFDDDTNRQQIDLAQLQVDEATRLRDAVRENVIKKKASCNEYRDTYEASRAGIRTACDALHLKRQEMDSVQSILNRINNAISIEEIDYRITTMQNVMEHETISLKEEKQLLREIKQLRFYRQQLRSTLDKQAEVQPTFNQKEELEERMKLLKQDFDNTRKEIVRIEGITDSARKIYFDEMEKLREMQSQFESANVLRQEAYAHLQKLKKRHYDENKYFRMYKDDARKAEHYGFSGDREALHSHCVNQVENIMELWNKNDEFRNKYIRSNMLSTVRRLGTLDGRLLGPDEDPPLLQKTGYGRLTVSLEASAEMNPISPVPTFEQTKPVLTIGHKNEEDMSAVKEKQKLKTVQSNEAIPLILNNSSATVFDEMEATENEQTQENTTVYDEMEVENNTAAENEQTQENEELVRKEESLRKEAPAAKIREQNLLEERAKGKEAEERKRRYAEKAQARAKIKAQKEVEHKEKVKAKRERRKGCKNAVKDVSEQGSSGAHLESTLPESTATRKLGMKPQTTITKAIGFETGERHTMTASKRSSSLFAKQTKVVSPPPSLLHKNKKRRHPCLQDLVMALFAVLAVLLIFLVTK